MDDTPLEESRADALGYRSTVIDLAGVRIAQGRPPFGAKSCAHRNLIYNREERRVWCEDCSRTIDNFDALMTISAHFDGMLREAANRLSAATEAKRHSARLRATKQLDRIWTGNVMAVACPHCKGGLLPEDFADGARAGWARDLEIESRKKKQREMDAARASAALPSPDGKE